MIRRLIPLFCAVLLLAGLSRAASRSEEVEASPDSFNPINTDLGYGFNMAAWDTADLQAMGFNWMKVFNAPGSQQPVNVLLRVDVTHADTADGVRNTVRALAQNNGAYIDAYEIGNEVNLDASYGWAASPVAADYVTLLCAAYTEIKTYDPTAIVVSAGLAPTGRVTGTWNGHAGHTGQYQDERIYFQEMLDAGAGACLDVVGYHNYGYSADFDAVPDFNGGTDDSNCSNGFCFRGVEKIYEMMQSNGLGDKKIWTTEYGWITNPSEDGLSRCLSDAGFVGREWQLVSHQEQADNLAGSFEYAAENWPWMGAMFVFNYNFNEAGYYSTCEQMRFYSVAGRAAESALSSMPKAYHFAPAGLDAQPSGPWSQIRSNADLPVTDTLTLDLTNSGSGSVTYTVSISGTADLVPTLTAGSLSKTLAQSESETLTFSLSLSTGALASRQYTGQITISTDPATIEGYPMTITPSLWVVDTVYSTQLPAIQK